MGFMDKLWGGKEEDRLPTEDTPFKPNRSTKENLQAAPEYLKRQASKLYQRSRQGPLSFRILAFLGGIGMICASIYDFIDSIFEDLGSGILITFYTLAFGIGICALEGKVVSFPPQWQRNMKFYFRILDYTWGRGVLYTFAGSLQLTQPNWANNASGIYMIFVGFVAVISSIAAGQKLAQLRIAIDSRRDLKAYFKEFDRDGDGTLTEKEFAVLMGNLGVEVSYQELVACFNAVDKNDDDRITFDEFNGWWTEWGRKHLHRGISDIIV